MSIRVRRNAFLLTVPAVIYMLLIVAYPFVLLVAYSLTNRRVGAPSEFIGLGNFAEVLSSSMIWSVFGNTIRYATLSCVVSLLIGLVAALLLSRLKGTGNTLQSIIVLPWAIPASVIALVWLWMFYDLGGVINWLFERLQLIDKPVSWLGLSSRARLAVLVPNIWKLSPFFAICLLSSLREVDNAALRAATLDGAGAIRRFLHISLPAMRRTIVVSFALAFLWSATEFPLIYILTRGGPANATHLLGTYSYELAMRGGFEIGLGAAYALFLVPIALGMALLVWKVGQWHK